MRFLGGHADALYEQAGDVASFIHGKQMRPIMMFGEKRSAAFKDVPSSHELEFNIALPQFRAIVVRAGTPPDRLEYLSEVFAKIARSPDYAQFLEAQFAAPDSFIDASKAPAFVRDQLEEMKKVVATNWSRPGRPVMSAARLRPALPYLVGLVVAAALYYAADHIAYTPRGSELGPDLWPKAAIGLMAIVCLVEIARALAGAGATRAVAELLAQEDGAGARPTRRSWSAASC